MAQRATAEGDEGAQLTVSVVDAVHECILVRRTATRGLGVGDDGVTQALERVLLHARHDFVARLLHGGVQRDGKRELLRLGGEATDLGEQAARGDRNVASADVEQVRVVHDAHGLERGVVVQERLALTHEDDARDALAEVLGNDVDLINDLAAAEAARVAVATGGAERAAHGAAGLGGHADRKAVVTRHADGLDGAAVSQAQQVLARAVLGDLLLGDGGEEQRMGLREVGAQVLADVGHLVVRLDALLVHPLGDLRGAVRGEAVRLEGVANLLAGEGLDADGVISGAFHVETFLTRRCKVVAKCRTMPVRE